MAALAGVYSFLNITCNMIGPGIVQNLAAGAAVAEEGLTLEWAADKNKMDVGADGVVQHTLMASDAATLTIRLLKTSPTNQFLDIAYNAQSVSSLLWGLNQFIIVDSARGDVLTLVNGAFKKHPALTYAMEAGMNEWVFDIASSITVLGA